MYEFIIFVVFFRGGPGGVKVLILVRSENFGLKFEAFRVFRRVCCGLDWGLWLGCLFLTSVFGYVIDKDFSLFGQLENVGNDKKLKEI